MNLPLSSVSEQPSANQADNREIVHQRKRILGSYYTPDGIAAAVVAMCHLPVDHAGFSGMNQEEGRSRYRNGRQSATHDDSRPLLDSCRFSPLPIRVLDPACGDGAFLLAWLQSQEQPGLDRLELVKDSVFGVDIDPIAIDGVRTRIAEWIGNQTSQPQNIRTILAKNLIWGDSLLGEDWTESSNSHSVEGVASSNDTARPEVDWNVQFSQIALEGGFDLILGNPPYRREKNAKTEFDRIAKSSLGRRWRRARMDLWHYF
ncbi:MAG: class I SAM-dependent methyltransferase, partial [Planctomycetes bacterium]|nr:class I SAM-dependent methyltransferase [Planctomycetota bacterium]